jgi:hypothetical protein
LGGIEVSLGYPLSGSHIDDVLARPGILSGANEPAGLIARPRRRNRLSKIFVVARSDGAVAINCDSVAAPNSPPLSDKDSTPVVFHFRTPGAAEAVMAGALQRLNMERMDESKCWFLEISPGQVAAAIKAEAKGLSYSFAVIHPYLADGPIVGSGKRSWARRATGMAPYAIFTLAGVVAGLIIGFALKGF